MSKKTQQGNPIGLEEFVFGFWGEIDEERNYFILPSETLDFVSYKKMPFHSIHA